MVTKRRVAKSAAKRPATCPTCCDPHPTPLPRCDRHNGWTNYETWLLRLWLTNDAGGDELWHAEGQAALKKATQAYDLNAATRAIRKDARAIAASALASTLKDTIEEQAADALPSGMFSDFLSAAVSEVNWYEVAMSFLPEEEA